MIMNFSDPSGGGGGVGSVLDSLKMSQQQLTPEQELKHQQQARKGIQTSPDGASHYCIVFRSVSDPDPPWFRYRYGSGQSSSEIDKNYAFLFKY